MQGTRIRLCATLGALAAVFTLAMAQKAPAARDGRAEGVQARAQAVTFLRGVIGALAANRYDVAWTTLAPAQQRLLPRATYVRCESLSPVPGRMTRIVTRSARSEGVVVPGSHGRTTRSIVVRFSVVLTGTAEQGSVTVPVVAHALRTDRGWAWMLPAKRLRQHRMPSCGQQPVGDPARAL